MAVSVLVILGTALFLYAATFWLRFPLMAEADMLMRTGAEPDQVESRAMRAGIRTE